MKTQIRSEVWETNSSSVHSFCFSKRGLEKCHMKIHEDGYVHITLDQYFGNDEEQFFNQKTKLKYIVTWLYTYYDDHQQLSSGWCDDNCIVSLWDSEACVEFIFNKYVGLETGCD